ncbi:hypothetical protein [Bifidobacterium psychraerophilum]|uniref:hypothetical protein n=1 Tax=Bifidobacterium psychraerophilum TaxID=218140 RepID=UPI0039ED6D7B
MVGRKGRRITAGGRGMGYPDHISAVTLRKRHHGTALPKNTVGKDYDRVLPPAAAGRLGSQDGSADD